MGKVKGVVFPLADPVAKNGVEEERDVFMKFTKLNVEPGLTLFLYASGDEGPRKIIAIAEITEIDTLPANQAWDKYGESMFPTESEFNDYIKNRESKTITAIILDQVKLLDEPIDPPGNITVAGLYVDEDKHEDFLNRLNHDILPNNNE